MSGNKEQQSKLTDAWVICFSGTDWWYHNRGLFCPQIMRRLAKDHKVLYVNSLGMRVPSLRKDKYAVKKITRKLRSISRLLRKVNDNMHVFSVLPFPFLGTKIGRTLNTLFVFAQLRIAMMLTRVKDPIIFVGCPPALEVVRKIKHRYLIYERTDLFEEMPEVDKPYITSLDNELVQSSDLVLYVDAAMYKEGVKQNRNSLLVGHGVDFSFFADADKSDYIPADVAKIPKPIIGYFGDISDRTFDFDLMQHLAASLPDMSFALVGPLSSNVDCLRRFKNIYILGQKAYEEIPHYGKVFDVSILPWTKNRWVMHSYPIKIKEYLALGSPFVTVDIPAVEDFKDVIYVANDYDDFVSKVCQAIDEDGPGYRQKRKERVRNGTWDSKVQQIIDFVKKDTDF